MESSVQTEMLAAAWIARRDRGNLSPAEEADLTQWLQASTANRVAFIRLEAAWRQANRLKVLAPGVSPGAMPAPGEWRQSPFFARRPCETASGASPDSSDERVTHPRPRQRMAWQVFSGLAASVLLAVLVISQQSRPLQDASFRTQTGDFASVPMVDGSKVALDTNSEIHVAVSKTERRVRLERGEAYFEVAKDAERPFIVNVGDLSVVAVGTRFSVRRETDEFRVVVTEGRVQVAKADAGRDAPIAQLSAGSIAYTHGDGVLVRQQPLAQLEELLSWRTGFVVFRGTTLAEAVAEFNRYSTRQMQIEDPVIAAIRISGRFRATNGDAFARLLENGFAIQADVSKEQIVLRAE
jgi:transmembrane sensor